MIKRIQITALLVLLVGTLGACDAIDINGVEPTSSVSSEVALTSRQGFEALLISVYDRLQNTGRYGQAFVLYPDALADNANVTQPNSNRYPGPVNNVKNAQLGEWGNAYVAINEANNILGKIDALDIQASDAQAVKDRLKGEAYFLRALNYFDLARTKCYEPGQEVSGFSDCVIIRTEATEKVEDADFRPRASNQEVYALIESDLQQSITLLDGVTFNKFRASQVAAQALLSRVYLYQGKWAQAAELAQDALGNTSVTLVQDTGKEEYLSAWLASTHPESVFELQMTVGKDGSTTNTNGALDALTNGAQNAFSFEVIPTVDLIAAHEAGDARLDLIADGFKESTPVKYMRKYTGTTAPNVDRVPVIRLSEIWLNLAEAAAEQGDASTARAALNAVRVARNLPAVDAGLSGQALIDAILHERRIELAFEGHRFFTLKRRGMDIPKPQALSGQAVLPYDDFRILAPLPSDEVDNNPNLEQNPGY